MKKAPFMTTVCVGDTYLDVHGYIEQIEEVYIHDTDIDVTEMLHALNWDKFEARFQEVMYA